MSRHRSLAAAAAAFLALLMVGCPGGGGSRSTPQETLQTMSSALNTGNRGQFISCWKADENQKKFLDMMFDMTSAPAQLKEAIVKTYGADGWTKFSSTSKMGHMGDMSPVDADKIAKANVEVKGDQATATIPGQGHSMTMVKEGGSWLMEAKQLPQQGIPAQAKPMMTAMKQSYEKVLADVGKSGQTPETLAAKLDTEMMSAMQPGAGQPRGFPVPGQK
jgi:hypothetical protein